MKREAMDLAPMPALHRLKESTRPAQIHITRMPARARCDQELRQITRELCDELAILRRVFARFHIAPAAPGLVADAPILHTEGFLVAVGRALVGKTFSPRRSVAIRDPIVKLLGRA